MGDIFIKGKHTSGPLQQEWTQFSTACSLIWCFDEGTGPTYFLRCLIRSSSGDCPSDIIFILIKPFTDCLVPCGWEGLSSQKLPCWMLVCNSGNPFFWWVYQKCCCCVYTPEISCYRCNIWVMKHIPVLHFITCGGGFTRWKRQVHAGTLFNVVCAVAVQQNSWRLDSE